MKCFFCNKGIMYGHNVSHSKRRTKRIFKPNLHQTKIRINGGNRRVRLCTKCLRREKAASSSFAVQKKKQEKGGQDVIFPVALTSGN